jgi:hypothetical protein
MSILAGVAISQRVHKVHKGCYARGRAFGVRLRQELAGTRRMGEVSVKLTQHMLLQRRERGCLGAVTEQPREEAKQERDAHTQGMTACAGPATTSALRTIISTVDCVNEHDRNNFVKGRDARLRSDPTLEADTRRPGAHVCYKERQ